MKKLGFAAVLIAGGIWFYRWTLPEGAFETIDDPWR
jgi:hypothetical protein